MSNTKRTILLYVGIVIAASIFGASCKLIAYALAKFDYHINALPVWINDMIIYIIALLPILFLLYLFSKAVTWLEMWSKGYYDKVDK